MVIGTRPEMDIPDKLISRPEIVKYLEEIFQSNKDQSNYYVIYGSKGNGKTTLAKKVANEVGKGVIYVDTPYDIERFEKSFWSKLDFTFDEDVSFLLQLVQTFFGKKIRIF